MSNDILTRLELRHIRESLDICTGTGDMLEKYVKDWSFSFHLCEIGLEDLCIILNKITWTLHDLRSERNYVADQEEKEKYALRLINGFLKDYKDGALNERQ